MPQSRKGKLGQVKCGVGNCSSFTHLQPTPLTCIALKHPTGTFQVQNGNNTTCGLHVKWRFQDCSDKPAISFAGFPQILSVGKRGHTDTHLCKQDIKPASKHTVDTLAAFRVLFSKIGKPLWLLPDEEMKLIAQPFRLADRHWRKFRLGYMNQHIRYEWTSLICNPVMLQHVHSEKFFYDTAVSEEAVTGHGVQIMFFYTSYIMCPQKLFFYKAICFLPWKTTQEPQSRLYTQHDFPARSLRNPNMVKEYMLLSWKNLDTA